MKQSTRFVAAAAGVAPVLVQVAPGVTWLRWPTVRLAPKLRGVGRSDHIAVTFDDGPDAGSTPLFLAELDRLGWTATFFLLGSMTRKSPEVARQIVEAGHEIGVHGDVHRYHISMTPAGVRHDLERAVATIGDATGIVPKWFRPPYGVLSVGSLMAARSLDLQPVLWTTWGRDWLSTADSVSVTDNVLSTLEPGGTILLHDSDCTSAPGSWRSAIGSLQLLADHIGPGISVGALRDHFDHL